MMTVVRDIPKTRWRLAWKSGLTVDDNAARSVKIFFWALAFTGVNLRDDCENHQHHHQPFKTIASVIVVLIQLTFCMLLAWFTCYTLFLSTEAFVRDRGYEMLYLFIFTFFTTINSVIHLVRRRRIIQFIVHLRTYLASNNSYYATSSSQAQEKLWKTERRWVTGALICTSISLTLQFIKNSLTLMVIRQGKAVATLPYATFLVGVSYVHVMFVHSFYSLSIGLFVTVCRLLRLAFAACPLPNTDRSRCTNRQWLVDMQRRHQHACALVKEADNVFSPIVFSWFASHVLCSCCMLRAFKTILFPTRQFSYQFMFDSIYYLSTTLLGFTVIALSAANANEQVTKSLEPLGNISCEDNSSSPSSLVDQIRATNYIVNVSAHPAGISGMGFFTVTRGLLLAIGGTIVTYTLVLYNL